MEESILKDLNQSTENDPRSGGNKQCGYCFAYFRTIFVYIFTDWPWETVKYINMPCDRPTSARLSLKPDTIQRENADEPNPANTEANTEKGCSWSLILWSVIMMFRLSVITTGLAVQLMTCFRRDRISRDMTPIRGPNSTAQLLRCTEKDEVICALLIPDLVIFLLAFWVYFALKFANQICRNCFGWRELRVVIKANAADNLNELVLAIDQAMLGKSITTGYIFISMFYILLSQGTSVLYLYAFQLADKDVIIQPPLQDRGRLSGDLKIVMIALSFVGFIALDLLYIRVIMRYVFRCQMIIYYLYMIRKNIDDNQKAGGKQNQQKSVWEENPKNKDDLTDNVMSCEDEKIQDVMQENEKTYKFVKYLNASSSTVGFVILLASYQAANCIVYLLGHDITYFQGGAIALRLTLWGFLAVFPFHKAAGVNIAFKRLRDLGWDIHLKPLGSPYRSNDSRLVNLKARVFGISVNPWLPYVFVMVLLLTIMIGAKSKWYERVL